MRKDRAFVRLLNLDCIIAPTEVAYLASNRQTIVGEIDRMKKGIERFPAEIEERNKVLEAIDLILARHKLNIDATGLPGVKRNKQSLLPHGKLQQYITRVFREAPEGAVLGSFTISSEVHRFSGLQLDRKPFNTLHKNVLKALNHLQKRGAIVRTNKLDTPSAEAAFWRVAD